MGLKEDVLEFGKRLLNRLIFAVHKLICNSDLSLWPPEKAMAVLAVRLIRRLGLSPAIAIIFATFMIPHSYYTQSMKEDKMALQAEMPQPRYADFAFYYDKGNEISQKVPEGYTIHTGSYPQIIHEPSWNATGGVITCTEFVDVNGHRHERWIPAIRLF